MSDKQPRDMQKLFQAAKQKVIVSKDGLAQWSSQWNYMQLLLLVVVSAVVITFGLWFTPLITQENKTSVALWAMWPLETVLFSYHAYFWNVDNSNFAKLNPQQKHTIETYEDWIQTFDNNPDTVVENKKTHLSAMPAANLAMQCYRNTNENSFDRDPNHLYNYVKNRNDLMATNGKVSVCACNEMVMREFFKPVLNLDNKFCTVNGTSVNVTENICIDSSNIAITNLELDDIYNNFASEKAENLSTACGIDKGSLKTPSEFEKCYNKLSLKTVDFCQKYSMPHMVKNYNGFVNMPILWIMGQVFIILSMFQHVFRDNLPVADKRYETSTKTITHWGMALVGVFVVVVILVLSLLIYFHVLPLHEYNTEQYNKIVSGANDKLSLIGIDTTLAEHTAGRDSNASLTIYALALVVVYFLIELVFLNYDVFYTKAEWFLKYFGSAGVDFQTQQANIININKYMFWQQIRTDVPFIFGLVMLFTVYQLQAGIQNVHTVIYIVLLSLVLGFLHHICNLLRSVWNVLSQIFLYDSVKPDDDEVKFNAEQVLQMQTILHFIFWTRSYIYCLMGLCLYFYIFNVDSTELRFNKATSYFQTLIPYVAVLLFACILLPDIAWEMAPKTFKNMQDQWRKRTFLICLFIVYVNWKQFLWAHINIDNYEQTYRDDIKM